MGVVLSIDGNAAHLWIAITKAIAYCDSQPQSERKLLVTFDTPFLNVMLGRLAFDEVVRVGSTNEVQDAARAVAIKNECPHLHLSHSVAEQYANDNRIWLIDAYTAAMGVGSQPYRPLMHFENTGFGEYLQLLYADRRSENCKNIGGYILITELDSISGDAVAKCCKLLREAYGLPIVIYTTKFRLPAVSMKVGTLGYVKEYPEGCQAANELAEALLHCRFHITTPGGMYGMASALEVPTLCLLEERQNHYRLKSFSLIYHVGEGSVFVPQDLVNDCATLDTFYDAGR